MSTSSAREETAPEAATRPSVNAANRRTLDQVFHHPISHNLAWDQVVALVKHVGEVEERSNDNFIFKIGRETYEARKPHTHHLTAPEVMGFRHFLTGSGWKPETHENDPSSATA